MSNKTIHIEHASIRQNAKNGYILVWKSDEMRMSSLLQQEVHSYESVISWYIYPTKQCAQDTIKLICIMAYLDTLDFSYTLHNTAIKTHFERDNAYLLLYSEDTTLLELWDDRVFELIEDGFIDPLNYHLSAVEYYNAVFALA